MPFIEDVNSPGSLPQLTNSELSRQPARKVESLHITRSQVNRSKILINHYPSAFFIKNEKLSKNGSTEKLN